MNRDRSFYERLVGFAAVEGILFSGSFCPIYKLMKHKLTDETVHHIIRGAVAVEQEFICDALPCSLIGMNSTQMIQYIEFVADRLLSALGHPMIYHVANPFDWMELISLQGKTNFFEKRVGEYQKKGVMASLDSGDNAAASAFALDEDF